MMPPNLHAGIALTSQDRFVDVVDDVGRHQHQMASDFGPFNGSVELSGGAASQTSTLNVAPSGDSAHFAASMFVSSPAINNQPVLSVQESQFKVNFDVTGAALPFRISYSSLLSFEQNPGPTGSFTGPSAPGTLSNGDVISGTLSPGSYELLADSKVDGQIGLDLQIGATAVPLPGALWATMLLLPAIALRKRFGRLVAVMFVGGIPGIALLFAAPAAAGVINLSSQNRFIDVTTSGVPGFGSPPTDQHASAPDFGDFNQSVHLDFPGITQTVNQNTTLSVTPDGKGAVIGGTGAIFSEVGFNGLNGTTHFQVSFEVTQPVPYFLTYNGQVGDPRPTSPKSFVPGLFIGPSAPGSLAGDPLTTNFFTTLTYSGTLQPGSYELQAEINTIGFGSFDVNLALGTAAVPLPSALWETLAWLPSILLIFLYVRRRSRVPTTSILQASK
jgi:hypothetical protein